MTPQSIALDHRQWVSLIERMATVLAAAVSERDQRRELIESAVGGPELAWVQYERQQMFAAVNDERKALGREPVTEEQVFLAEGRACGHIDYARKYALGCAQLVTG